jgi:uncharacterized lipoprotein YmbA
MNRRTFMSRSTVVAFAVLLLAACGTSPPARYYALSEPAATAVAKSSTAVVLFGPFNVAPYLQRPQIIVRDANHQLQLAEFDRWAESPQVAVVPWVARDVDRQLANAVVVAFPSVGHADAPYRVRGTISQWDTDASGAAVLVVQWESVTDTGTVLVPLRTSRFTAQATKPGNYGDIVRAMNQTLADFAGEVATALRAALPQEATNSG